MSWHILIVDDEINLAKIIQAGLATLPNCTTAVAMSALAALQLFEDETFDLLITDVRMPGMDGLTLARHVQTQSPHTAVILLTAYAAELDHDLAITCILEKPVTLPVLRATILDILEHRQGTA